MAMADSFAIVNHILSEYGFIFADFGCWYKELENHQESWLINVSRPIDNKNIIWVAVYEPSAALSTEKYEVLNKEEDLRKMVKFLSSLIDLLNNETYKDSK